MIDEEDNKTVADKYIISLNIFPTGKAKSEGWNCAFSIDNPRDGEQYLLTMFESIIDKLEGK